MEKHMLFYGIAFLSLVIAVCCYLNRIRKVSGSDQDLYTEEELNNGMDLFRTWYKSNVKPSLPLGATKYVIEGESLRELQGLMDERFAILISELNGTPITKLVGSDYTNYTIKVR